MTRKPRCPVCKHPRRKDVELALLAQRGTRIVGRAFKLESAALAEHRLLHMGTKVKSGKVGTVVDVRSQLQLLYDTARTNGDLATAVRAMAELRQLEDSRPSGPVQITVKYEKPLDLTALPTDQLIESLANGFEALIGREFTSKRARALELFRKLLEDLDELSQKPIPNDDESVTVH